MCELAEQIDNAALLFVQCTLHADNVALVQRHIALLMQCLNSSTVLQ